jgi:hypothetical protein
MIKNNNIKYTPDIEIVLRQTENGNKKEISKSNIINKIATM